MSNIIKKAKQYVDDKLVFEKDYSFNYNKMKFKPNKFITSGSFSNIFGYDYMNKSKIVIKFPLKNESNDSEIKILTLLNAFQNEYLKRNLIVSKIYKVFIRTNFNNSKIIILKKYDGDIYKRFTQLNLDLQDDKLLFLNLLKQISQILIILQKHFHFMHNDMKPNNILYKFIDSSIGFRYDNIQYYLSDFGGSFINLNNKKICGNIRGCKLEFNPNKDMFMMIHLIFTFIDDKYKESALLFLTKLFGKDNINTKYSKYDKSTWFSYYDIDNISDLFNPINILNKVSNKLQLE